VRELRRGKSGSVLIWIFCVSLALGGLSHNFYLFSSIRKPCSRHTIATLDFFPINTTTVPTEGLKGDINGGSNFPPGVRIAQWTFSTPPLLKYRLSDSPLAQALICSSDSRSPGAGANLPAVYILTPSIIRSGGTPVFEASTNVAFQLNLSQRHRPRLSANCDGSLKSWRLPTAWMRQGVPGYFLVHRL
jgi:hypothetical protein